MKIITVKALLIIICFTSITNCFAQKRETFKAVVVYSSDILRITQISANAFVHTSFLKTQDFGDVACNGLFVRDHNETIIFDTPTNNKSAEELITWIKEGLSCKINAIIPTHFHDDCLGGLKAFDENNVYSYAYYKTIELAKENNFVVPKNSFKEPLNLKVGNENVLVKFFGEGHTRDNVVGYFPSENILFGGCLIKELGATKGFLGDANINAWSETVRKIKLEYPSVKIIIPGHGNYGNKKLLDYTIKLFKTQ